MVARLAECQPENAMARRKRILVIEDHDDTRKALLFLLIRQGFDVSAYASCKAAEHHLEHGDIDIALLDVRMPIRSGDDFGKELRGRFHQISIVFLTGELLLEPLKIAVPDCLVLQKPVDPAKLLQALGSSMDTGQAVD
jgi:FixJ family two-component response regulator